MKRLFIKLLSTAIVAAICMVAVGVGALAATVKMRGGEWRMPAASDVKAIVVAADRRDPAPARTIYLAREAMTISHGRDNAALSMSSLVAPGKAHTVPRYRASNKNWNRLVTCVEDKFKGLDVRITDQLPEGHDHVVVKVGGKQRDIGKKGKAIGGIAPFHGGALNNVIVFAFDQGGKYRTRTNCETIAHEIGHIYGLDHTYHCKDIMSYQQGCGKKTFQDKHMHCGEDKTRECVDARPGQNSAEHLMTLLGPARD